MTTHDVDIYHCQKCGRVVSCEHEDGAPKCCGEAMAQAVANITYEDDRDHVSSTKEAIEGSHQLNASNRK